VSAAVFFPWPDGMVGAWMYVAPDVNMRRLFEIEEALHLWRHEILARQLLEHLREDLD